MAPSPGVGLQSVLFLLPLLLLPPFSSASSNSSLPPLPPSRCPSRCSCAHSTVICTGLGLTRVPIGIPPGTTRLDLQENQIQRIHKSDFVGLGSLRVLHLGDNAIEAIDQGALDPLGSLERLRIGRNRIRSLPEGILAKMTRLRRLDLTENGLWSLSADQLAGPAELVSLQLDRNHLQCVDPLALSQWPTLESLSLASNALFTLAQLDLMAMPNLRTLRLSDNPWHCDCRLRWLKRLKIASQIRCHRPSHLFGRSLDQISIQQLKCSGMEKRSSGSAGRRCRDADWCPPGCTCTESGPGAVVVDCHDRLLRSIPQRLPPSTVELRLEQNRLTHLDNRSFAHVPNLVRLDLSKNAIERIDADAFAGLHRLSSLMIFANNLTDLPEGTFAPMGSFLQVLLLNGNRLHCLRNGLFRGLSQLKLLSLYDNQIRSIAEPTFASFAHSLQILHLARNPLICDCNLAWMARWLSDRPIETSGARCHSPKRMARRRIGAGLDPDRFRCSGAEGLVTRGAGECAVDRECPEQCRCRGTTVDCSSRQLSAPPTSLPRFTSSLLLRSNALTRLTPLEGVLPNLVHLDLSDNQIESIPPEFLAAFPALRELDLGGNLLRRLSVHSLGPSALSLTNLHLDGNSLRCLALDQFPSLRSLSLRQNPLLSLNGDSVLDQLELLGLDGSSRFICDCNLRPLVRRLRRMGKNWTEDWDEDGQGMPRCAEPEQLRGKALTELDEETELICQDGSAGGVCSADGEFCPSGCSCQPSAASPAALSVRCSGLDLSRIPRGLPEDTAELFLDNNRIEHIRGEQFGTLGRLHKLDLSHNRIRHISSGTFASLPALSTLILAYNRIQCIHSGAFNGLNQLRVLSLHENDLSQLPEASFAPLLANLSHVALGANPFWCDCEMNWVGKWLRSRFVEPGIAKCEGPPERKDQLLLSADPFPECSLAPVPGSSPATPVSVLAKCHPCLGSPCANLAPCHPLPSGAFRCECSPGFHGSLCELPVDACFGMPCQNGGTCRVIRGGGGRDEAEAKEEVEDEEDEGRFRCECPPGFGGERCERERDECTEDGGRERCRNGGTCRDQMNGFRCACRPGFVGPFCEAHLCSSSPSDPSTGPCQNGAICIPSDSEDKSREEFDPLGYRCLCPEGFSGPNCSIPRGINCADNGVEGALCEALVAPGRIEAADGREEEKRRTRTRTERAQQEQEQKADNTFAECPFGFMGPNCTGRRAIGLIKPDAMLQLREWPESEDGERRVEMVLRTKQRGGVLLFAGDPSAFVLLELVQGRLRAALMLSPAHAPPSQLFSLANVDDGLAHSVLLRLHGPRLSLQLDSFPLQSVLNSGPPPPLPPPQNALLPLFIGGIPSELGRRALIQFRISDSSGIRGCFSDIRLNNLPPVDLNSLLGPNATFSECSEAVDLCLGKKCEGKGRKCRMVREEPEGWKCVEDEEGGKEDKMKKYRKGEEEGRGRKKEEDDDEEGAIRGGTRNKKDEGGGTRRKCSRERAGRGRGTHWTDGECRSVRALPGCGGHCEDEEEGKGCCVAVEKRKRRVEVSCKGRKTKEEEMGEEEWRMVEVARKCACIRRREEAGGAGQCGRKG